MEGIVYCVIFIIIIDWFMLLALTGLPEFTYFTSF